LTLTAIGATPPATTTATAQATVIEVKVFCAATVCAVVITDKDKTSCVAIESLAFAAAPAADVMKACQDQSRQFFSFESRCLLTNAKI
jgi:hypothetical protein